MIALRMGEDKRKTRSRVPFLFEHYLRRERFLDLNALHMAAPPFTSIAEGGPVCGRK